MAITGGVAFAPSVLGGTVWVTQPPLGGVLPAGVLQPWGIPVSHSSCGSAPP